MILGRWTFDSPIMFLLLILIVPLAYVRYFWRKGGGKLLLSFSNWNGQSFRNSLSLHLITYLFAHTMFWIGIILAVMALAGPSRIYREKIFTTRGIDIMLLIDISPSMAAQDFSGLSSLESTKEMIQRFVVRRKNDPIGLTVFGSEVALRSPPTLNYDFLDKVIDDLQVMELGEGTALGMGIALAALHLRHSSTKEKVIILFTDGENNAGTIEPQDAANLVAGAGIRMYIIDIGSDRQAAIEFTDPDTGKLYRATYQSQQQGDILHDIARATGGDYYSVTNPYSLENVLLSIDALERVETRPRVDVQKKPQYRQMIIIAFILIFLDYFLRKVILREVL